MIFIPDQFEVEPLGAFHNSYTDRIYVGDFLSASHPSFATGSLDGGAAGIALVVKPYRTCIGSHIYKFREAWHGYYGQHPSGTILPEGYELDIQLFQSIYEGSYMSPTQNRVVKHYAVDEIYADSVMPYPPDIFLLNGGQFCRGWIEHDSDLAVEGLPQNSSTFNLNLSTPFAPLTSSVDDSQVSDDIWAFSYPFEGKYSTAQRLFSPSYFTEYKIPVSQSHNDWEDPVSSSLEPLAGSLFTLRFMIPRTNKDSWKNNDFGETLLTAYDRIENRNSEKVVDGKNWHPPFGYSLNHKFGGAAPGANFAYMKWPSIETVYRAFFGFFDAANFNYSGSMDSASLDGQNVAKFPIADDITLTAKSEFWADPFTPQRKTTAVHTWPYRNVATQDYSAGVYGGRVKIHGYKYGCINANKLKSVCCFRRNKFGQMRDMLEQRLYTKYYDNNTATALEAAVMTSFVSGSDVWITASQPSLNTFDSGNWDREAKSGHPFADRDGSGYKATES